jgi:hypothetical protein
MFAAFLSPDMSYSCPIWEIGNPAEWLEDAQLKKFQNIMKKRRLKRKIMCWISVEVGRFGDRGGEDDGV